jgi:D-amino-acid dehydrogenase
MDGVQSTQTPAVLITSMAESFDVVVVGGGVIGWSVASAVSRLGRSVVVVDPGPPLAGTSSANAGHLVPSHVIPFAAPGMVRAGLRSLVTRDGAFAIDPLASPFLGTWLWRFARSSTAANVRRGLPALRYLLDSTVHEVHRLAAAHPGVDHVSGGMLQACTSARSLAAAGREAEEMARHGVRVELLDRSAVHDHEPMLTDAAVGGVLLEDDSRFDPAGLVAALRAEAEAAGASVRCAAVVGIHPADDAVTLDTTTGAVRGAHAVLAAGVWTPALCRHLGVRLPVVPARGNGVTLPVPAPRRPMLLVDQRVALSPLARGLRLTARYELTRPASRDVSLRRCAAIVRRAAEALRLEDTSVHEPWTGLRPATPDGLPIIGRLPGAPRVVVATGHGMLGSSCGPGTGLVVAAMLAGAPTGFDDTAVSPARFVRPGRRLAVRQETR